MTTLEQLPVQIGEVKVGYPGQCLNAILGSCIGIGVLHKERRVFGLAHALLAQSTGPAKPGSGRHVDHAIQSLLIKMKVPDPERKKLRVFLAGGANMTLPAGTDERRLVGSQNADFARKALKAEGLRMIQDDTGGEHGRRVTINCNTGEFKIDRIPRLGEVT